MFTFGLGYGGVDFLFNVMSISVPLYYIPTQVVQMQKKSQNCVKPIVC